MFGAVFLLYTAGELGFDPGVLGMTWAVGGVASLIGATFAGRVAARLGLGPALMLGLSSMGVAMLLIPAAHDASIYALMMMIGSQFGDGLYMVWQVNHQTLKQSITPPELLGRVSSGFRVSNTVAMLLGALAGGVMGELVGLRETLVVSSGVMIASGLFLVITPVWQMRETPSVELTVLPEPMVSRRTNVRVGTNARVAGLSASEGAR